MGQLADIYDRIIAPFDWLGVQRWREWVTHAARGYTLEIGVGTGLNLQHYASLSHPASSDTDEQGSKFCPANLACSGAQMRNLGYGALSALAAIDPDGTSLQHALARRNGRGARIALYQARAEALPFADESFDAVVGTLTFCSIGEPERAAREVWRVLKPGGALRLVEHVRVENRLLACAQDALTPLWRELAGNCHLNRATPHLIARAGLRVRAVHRLVGSLFVGIDAVKEIGD